MPVLVLLGLVRAVALLRRGTGASWRDALGAFLIWQSTSLVVARASVLGLFAKKAAFLVTPKTSEQAKWWEALRANWAESTLALLGLRAASAPSLLTRPTELAGPLLAALLVFPTIGMAAAPVNSWAAQRAALPATTCASAGRPSGSGRSQPYCPGAHCGRGRGRHGRRGRRRGRWPDARAGRRARPVAAAGAGPGAQHRDQAPPAGTVAILGNAVRVDAESVT